MLCVDGRRVRVRRAPADERARRRRCRGPTRRSTFTPGGFVPSEDQSGPRRRLSARPDFRCCSRRSSPSAVSMRCSSSRRLRARCWCGCTFVAGAPHGRARSPARLAAVLIAASPAMLYQVVQPMNDVTTAALVDGDVRRVDSRAAGCSRVCLRPRTARPPEPAAACASWRLLRDLIPNHRCQIPNPRRRVASRRLRASLLLRSACWCCG